MSDEQQILLADEYATPAPMMDAYLEALGEAYEVQFRNVCIRMNDITMRMLGSVREDDRIAYGDALSAMSNHLRLAMGEWYVNNYYRAHRHLRWALEKGAACQ